MSKWLAVNPYTIRIMTMCITSKVFKSYCCSCRGGARTGRAFCCWARRGGARAPLDRCARRTGSAEWPGGALVRRDFGPPFWRSSPTRRRSAGPLVARSRWLRCSLQYSQSKINTFWNDIRVISRSRYRKFRRPKWLIVWKSKGQMHTMEWQFANILGKILKIAAHEPQPTPLLERPYNYF